MIFDILTLFPGIFESPIKESMIKRAVEAGLIRVNIVNIRDFAPGKHSQADDRPYGGGSGMVLKVEPIVGAIRSLTQDAPRKPHVVLLSPKGRTFDQEKAEQLVRHERLSLVCGHYEGVDQRIADHYVDDEVSVGDFVLTGGEIAALVILDAVTRLIPGVLGNVDSLKEESFCDGLIEYPQYTRPVEFEGHGVPEVLLSGNHGQIQDWRKSEALRRTKEHRPDLASRFQNRTPV